MSVWSILPAVAREGLSDALHGRIHRQYSPADGGPAIENFDELRDYLRSGVRVTLPRGWRCWHSQLTGGNGRNHDGSERQRLIAGLRIGDRLSLSACQTAGQITGQTAGGGAVQVATRHGQIGLLPMGHGCLQLVAANRLAAFVAAIKVGLGRNFSVDLLLVQSPVPLSK